jgi:nucleotide-binding universal stress UspA family protein
MSSIQTILHPTDFSEGSRQAFGIACSLARDLGARVVVLHVAQPPAKEPLLDLVSVVPPPPGHREALEQRLHWLAAPYPEVRLERRLEEGDTVRTILDAASETRADLIVMGSHGRTGLGRVLLGSVAEQLLRQAPCPVLTTKGPPPAPPPAAGTEANEPC